MVFTQFQLVSGDKPETIPPESDALANRMGFRDSFRVSVQDDTVGPTSHMSVDDFVEYFGLVEELATEEEQELTDGVKTVDKGYNVGDIYGEPNKIRRALQHNDNLSPAGPQSAYRDQLIRTLVEKQDGSRDDGKVRYLEDGSVKKSKHGEGNLMSDAFASRVLLRAIGREERLYNPETQTDERDRWKISAPTVENPIRSIYPSLDRAVKALTEIEGVQYGGKEGHDHKLFYKGRPLPLTGNRETHKETIDTVLSTIAEHDVERGFVPEEHYGERRQELKEAVYDIH